MRAPRDAAPRSPTSAVAVRTTTPQLGSAAARDAATRHLGTAPVLDGPGQPVPADVRARLERSFGATLGHVRLHADAEGAALAAAFGARAVTMGSHIALSEFATPQTADGYRTLAHEITHVLQQGSAPVGPALYTQPRDNLERSAAETAGRVAAGGLAGPVATVGRPLLACDKGPFDLAREGLDRLGDWADEKLNEKLKKPLYEGLIKTLQATHHLSRARLAALRSRVTGDAALAVFDAFATTIDVGLTIFEGLLLAGVGIVAGFTTGILQNIGGLLRLILGLLEGIFAVFYALVDRGQMLSAWASDVVRKVKLIPEGLRTMADDYRREFQASSPERGALMMGEVVGQVLAFIATLGIGESKAGNLAQTAKLAPKLAPKLAALIEASEPAMAVVGGGTEGAAVAASGTAKVIVKGATIAAGGTGAAAVTAAGRKPKPDQAEPSGQTSASESGTTQRAPSKVPAHYKITKVSLDPKAPNYWAKTAEVVPQPPEAIEFPNGARAWRMEHGGPVWQEGDIGPGIGRAHYEKLNYSASEHGRPPGPKYERPHSLGQGTGFESPYAIWPAPSYVNQTLQNHGIEEFMRRLHAHRKPSETFRVVTRSQAHPRTTRLSEIRYQIQSVRPSGVSDVAEYRIRITGTEAHPVVTAEPITFADNPVAQAVKAEVPQPPIITQAVHVAF